MDAYKVYEVDDDNDGLLDSFSVRSMNFDTPLIGDHRGVEIALIRFIPSRDDSRTFAWDLAHRLAMGLTDQAGIILWQNAVVQQKEDYCCDPF